MNDESSYKLMIKKDFEEWLDRGQCSKALQLNKAIGEEYFDTSNPHYFTGDLTAELVLVHHNPKRNKPDFSQEASFTTFDEYWDFYEKFGKHHYGKESGRTHKSPFDHKQIRFLKPFNTIQFSENDVYHNLQKVIDDKLQIELIPYGSPDFDHKHIGFDNIKPFIDSVLLLIASSPRKYVIFCGKVFCSLLEDYIESREDYKFKLTKKDGSKTRVNYEFHKVTLKIGEHIINAGIAPQYAIQGAPISSYGEKIVELYHDE